LKKPTNKYKIQNIPGTEFENSIDAQLENGQGSEDNY